MKQKLKTIITVVILITAVIWGIDKVPFSKDIKHEISANIYKNGVVTGQTTVSIEGEKSNYLFREAEKFTGRFAVQLIEKTADKDLQAYIKWSSEKDENARQLRYFKAGSSFSAEAFGIVPYMLINDSMTKFAIMLTDNTVIATSDELQALYTKHITWDADTASTTIVDANQIPEID